MIRLRRLSHTASILVAVLALTFTTTGCDSADDEGPEGTYTATRFVVDPFDAAPIDVLAGGGSLTLTLRTDGTFSGSIFVPEDLAGDPGEGDLDEDFSGTYTVDGDDVTFSTDADLFISDVDWTLDGDRLRTEDTAEGSDAVLIIELER